MPGYEYYFRHSTTTQCSLCHRDVSTFEVVTTSDGQELCSNCRVVHDYGVCSFCGRAFPGDEMFDAGDDRRVCSGCYEHTFECDRCGYVVYENELYNVRTTDGITERWCDCCMDDHTFICAGCGTRVSDEVTAYPYCPECANRQNTPCNIGDWIPQPGRGDYYYNPKPHFAPNYDENTIFYGFELEVDGHGKDLSDVEDDCYYVSRASGYTYCKRDGSIGTCGADDSMEIVSHPATMEYHMSKKEMWENVFKKLVKDGYDSHNSGTCGLHVHASLAPIEARNPYAVHNILILVDRFWEQMKRFARRTDTQLNRWAKRYSTKDKSSKNLKDVYKSYQDYDGHDGRYMAINLMTGKDHRGRLSAYNAKTIEFRLFRGSLNIETFYATLQFVDTIIRKAIEIGDNADYLQAITWSELTVSNYTELNSYLERRGLTSNPNEDVDKHGMIPGEVENEVVHPVNAAVAGTRIRTGDRVQVTIIPNDDYYPEEMRGGCQLVGTVVNRSWMSDTIAVLFPTYVPGMHGCGGQVSNGRGLFVKTSDIRLINNEEDTNDENSIGSRVSFVDPEGGITYGTIRDFVDAFAVVKCNGEHKSWMHSGGITGAERCYYFVQKSNLQRGNAQTEPTEDTSRIIRLPSNETRYNNSGVLTRNLEDIGYGSRIMFFPPPQDPQQYYSEGLAGIRCPIPAVVTSVNDSDITLASTSMRVSFVDPVNGIREQSVRLCDVELFDNSEYGNGEAWTTVGDISNGWNDRRYSASTIVKFKVCSMYDDEYYGRDSNGRRFMIPVSKVHFLSQESIPEGRRCAS